MKLKFTLLSALLALCFSVKAQEPIPNGGFENWTQNNHPDGWATYESVLGYPGNALTFEDMTDKVEGNASVKIITDSIPLVGTFDGIVSTGSGSIIGGGLSLRGIPFSTRPDTLYFSYKYTSPVSDTALLILQSTNSTSGFVLNRTFFLLTKDSSWKNIYIPLTSYYAAGTNNPDSLLIAFSSGLSFFDGGKPRVGSTLHVDNVHFGAGIYTGVNEIKNQIGLKVYPNPTSANLNITANKTMEGYNVQVYNMNGQLVSNKVLDGTVNTLNLTNLSTGNYIYRITDKQNNIIDQSKISVQK